ncbi:MAG: hypothetical protein Q9193_002071 [Seirophora villosa]
MTVWIICVWLTQKYYKGKDSRVRFVHSGLNGAERAAVIDAFQERPGYDESLECDILGAKKRARALDREQGAGRAGAALNSQLLRVATDVEGGAQWAGISAMGPPNAQACATLQIDPWNPVLASGRRSPLNAWQVVYVAWALKAEEAIRGHILADDMGLGKTTSVLSLIIVAARRAGAD